MMTALVILLLTCSVTAKNMNEGPKVININNSDGGYFVVFKNDRMEKTLDTCGLQGLGSPYALNVRSIINITVEPMPSHNNHFFLQCVLCHDPSSFSSV